MKTKEFISKLNGMPNIESFKSISGINVYNLGGKAMNEYQRKQINMCIQEMKDDGENLNLNSFLFGPWSDGYYIPNCTNLCETVGRCFGGDIGDEASNDQIQSVISWFLECVRAEEKK